MATKPIPVSRRQADVDKALRDCFKEKDITNVATRLGYKDPSPFSRQLNWQEPNENAVFKMLEFIEHLRDEREELARDVLSVYDHFLGQIMGEQPARVASEDTVLNMAQKSISELMDARFSNLPFSERLQAARDLKQRATELEREYMDLDCEDGQEDEPARTGRPLQSLGRAS